MKITEKNCTGCGACSAACPVSCIEMKSSKKGFLWPVVDEERCLGCRLCVKTCPQNVMPETHFPQKCYAAWSKNESDYIFSASGGVGATIARKQFSTGGAFFGCDYQDDGELEYFPVNCESDVARIQSSKYSQSQAFSCFSDIRQLLKKEISVVFVGTPCQCAALLNYVGGPSPYLITIDLVCHGTPPNSYLKQHIRDLNLSFPVSKIRFRGEFDQKLTIWKDGSVVYCKNNNEDTYFRAFYRNMISYDACFDCQYAQASRISDITIGDFWGLKELRTIERKSKRPSVILINTQKGNVFFRNIQNDLIIEERTPSEAIQGNGRLMTPPGKNIQAKVFQFLYGIPCLGFDGAVKISFTVCALRLCCLTIIRWPLVFGEKVCSKLKGVAKRFLEK